MIRNSSWEVWQHITFLHMDDKKTKRPEHLEFFQDYPWKCCFDDSSECYLRPKTVKAMTYVWHDWHFYSVKPFSEPSLVIAMNYSVVQMKPILKVCTGIMNAFRCDTHKSATKKKKCNRKTVFTKLCKQLLKMKPFLGYSLWWKFTFSTRQ